MRQGEEGPCGMYMLQLIVDTEVLLSGCNPGKVGVMYSASVRSARKEV